MERTELLRDLRLGVFDVLVGINLLREGIDLPEVTLVAILDADKEGFLRSETSLVQTIGRAARNVGGKVIMYADTVTRSMKLAIDETNRRRAIQQEYNEKHGITPQTIRKSVRDVIDIGGKKDENELPAAGKRTKTRPADIRRMSAQSKEDYIAELRRDMAQAAAELRFEEAAWLRDRIREVEVLKSAGEQDEK
jgi:excinuclease ABC subunit B